MKLGAVEMRIVSQPAETTVNSVFKNDPAPWRRLPVKLLLTLATAVILGTEYHEIHDHILLSDGSRRFQDSYSVGHALLM
jgi:hypothetical protein